MIQPTTRFDQMRTQRSMAFRLDEGEEIDVAALSNPTAGALPGGGVNATFCNTTITPTCLRELYNVGKFQGSLKNGNLLGICGYLEEYAKYADLEQFVTTYTPEEDPAIANFTYVLINGGLSTQNDTVDDDVEANCKCGVDASRNPVHAISSIFSTPLCHFYFCVSCYIYGIPYF